MESDAAQEVVLPEQETGFFLSSEILALLGPGIGSDLASERFPNVQSPLFPFDEWLCPWCCQAVDCPRTAEGGTGVFIREVQEEGNSRHEQSTPKTSKRRVIRQRKARVRHVRPETSSKLICHEIWEPADY